MTKTFKEVIAGIRTAIYGREVREDIAQGMEYVEQFAQTAIDKAAAALQSAKDALASASAAKTSETNAASSQNAAASSASAAATSASNAKTSEGNAAWSAEKAESAKSSAASSAASAAASAHEAKIIAASGDDMDKIMLFLVVDQLTFGLYTSTGDVLCTSAGDTLIATKQIGG